MEQNAIKTQRDCHCPECNGSYLLLEGEMWCDTCYFTPEDSVDPRSSKVDDMSEWQSFWYWRSRARGRKWCVGGVPFAYYGSGEYELDREGNWTQPPRYRLK